MRAVAKWSWVLGVAGLVLGAGPAFGQGAPPGGAAGTPPTAGPGAGAPGAPGAGRRAPDFDKIFDRLDRDQSGEVSEQEYQGARRRMGRRGRRQGRQGRRGRRGGQRGTPPSGSTTTTPPAPGAGGPGAGGPGAGGPGAGHQGRGRRGRRGRRGMLPPFAFLDDDSNQSLTRDEFKSGITDWRDALKAFRQADTDHDRKLSETEYQAGGFTAPFASLKGSDDFVDGKEYHDAVVSAGGKP